MPLPGNQNRYFVNNAIGPFSHGIGSASELYYGEWERENLFFVFRFKCQFRIHAALSQGNHGFADALAPIGSRLSEPRLSIKALFPGYGILML